jgi:hypothetical protein
MTVEYNGKTYDDRHGGPFDRGSADSYYGRPFRPHYFLGATYSTPEVIPEEGSAEYEAYEAGFMFNEMEQNFKDWGR